MDKNKQLGQEKENIIPTEEELFRELKKAYKSINTLKESPSHRKITLELERRLRKEKKK